MVRQNSKNSLKKASSSASLGVKPFQMRDILSNNCEDQLPVYLDQRIPETDQSVQETLRIFDEQKIKLN